MSSAVQITASQANAKLLYSQQAVLLTEADHQEFQTLTSDYENELRPTTPVQRTFFTQLVLAVWNIQRANRLEAALAIAEGVDPLLSENKAFARIATARVRTERTFNKCIKELRALQATEPPSKPVAKYEPKQNNSSKDRELQNEPNKTLGFGTSSGCNHLNPICIYNTDVTSLSRSATSVHPASWVRAQSKSFH